MYLEGFEATKAKFDALSKIEAKKVTRKGLRAGAKIVKSEIGGLIPVKSGNAKRNLKVKAAKRRKGAIAIIVGFGKKWFAGPAFYASFLVFGHLSGKRGSPNRRKVQPNLFMQKGYEASKAAALDKITDTYKELLDT